MNAIAPFSPVGSTAVPESHVGIRPLVPIASRITNMIYGRDAERSHLADVVEAARAGISGALVVRGEPGAGTSTLLDDLAARCGDVRTLRALGLQSESELAFSGLGELLSDLRPHFGELAHPRRAALESALGLAETDSPPDRFVVAAAVLDLLAAAAEQGPLLAIVDDAQWLDGASQDALLFVARRLGGEGIALVFGASDDATAAFDAPGVPALTLPGLDEAAALALIRQRNGTATSAAVVARLVVETRGNPLALGELALLIDAAALRGEVMLPDPLPLARGTEAVFRTRVAQLPERTRAMLHLAALEPAADLAVLEHAGAALGATPGDLQVAATAGLVRMEADRVVFDHPLVRSAAEAEATSAQRRRAHLALAEALPASEDARSAWHAAAAASEPDEQLAADLEALARRARSRAGNAAAQAALTRAAELTPAAPARGRRLLAAADAAWRAGRAPDALTLVERAAKFVEEPHDNARVARLRGVITLRTGSLADAHRLLMDAAALTAEIDPKTAYMLVGEAAKAGGRSGNQDWLVAAADLAGSLDEPSDEASRVIRLAVTGFGKFVAGDAAELDDVLAAAHASDEPELLEYGVVAAGLIGDEVLAARLIAKAERSARRRTMIAVLPLFLSLRAASDYQAGRLAGAAAAADEGARLAREAGQTAILAANLAHVARTAAVRGDAARFATATGEANALAGEHGLEQVASIVAHAIALHEIGLGRYEAALDALARVTHPSLAAGRASDACDVAIHLDRPADALDALAQLERQAAAARLPWIEGLAERARGLTAVTRGDRSFVRALALHGDARPFERARTELAYGETLRRTRRRVDARAPLHRALEEFARIGAEPWAARADRELRATGETGRRRYTSTIDRLTPQELAICQLVAEGLGNDDVASRLFLSLRTIDYHLRKIFAKLGIGSRAELVLLDLGASEQGEHRHS
jgi:DNA-binding CsgD family transcriptional regulator